MDTMLTTPATTVDRTLVRVTSKLDLGADEQVDAKAIVFGPREQAEIALADPFLALVEDQMSSRGFSWHPHRGLETVTLVVDGVLEHGDNLGNAGALQAGEVQWMTAGHGIIHRELAYRDERAHVLQMWLNLPAAAKLVPAGYQDLVTAAIPRLTRPGVAVDVHSGTVEDTTGPADNQHPVQGVLVTLDPGTTYDLAVPADHRLFAYVLDGAGQVGGTTLHAGQVGWSDPVPAERSSLPIDTHVERPLRVLVYSGAPLHEPVALGGPFVMNSRTEIAQAYRDLRTGEFGPVPTTARAAYAR